MYVLVPPDHEDVKVIVLPEAWFDGREGVDVKVGVPKAEFTLTKSVPDVADVGVVAESVTL